MIWYLCTNRTSNNWRAESIDTSRLLYLTTPIQSRLNQTTVTKRMQATNQRLPIHHRLLTTQSTLMLLMKISTILLMMRLMMMMIMMTITSRGGRRHRIGNKRGQISGKVLLIEIIKRSSRVVSQRRGRRNRTRQRSLFWDDPRGRLRVHGAYKAVIVMAVLETAMIMMMVAVMMMVIHIVLA